MIHYQCPHCNQPLKIPDQYEGQRGTCKKCNGTIVVPRQLSDSPLAGEPESISLTSAPPELPASSHPPQDPNAVLLGAVRPTAEPRTVYLLDRPWLKTVVMILFVCGWIATLMTWRPAEQNVPYYAIPFWTPLGFILLFDTHTRLGWTPFKAMIFANFQFIATPFYVLYLHKQSVSQGTSD